MAYELDYPIVSNAQENERASFIRRTYAHLAGAVLAFTALEFLIFNALPAEFGESMLRFVSNPVSALILIAAFIGVGYLARWWAFNGGSQALQYAGLALYVVFEAVIFVPLLFVVLHYAPNAQGLLFNAGALTLCIFAGLTTATFITRTDFSFLRSALCIGSWLLLGVAVLGIIGGFDLGLLYPFAAVALASGFILYDTSNVMLHFRTDQHVAASLELFASLAYLFYYIVVLLLRMQRR